MVKKVTHWAARMTATLVLGKSLCLILAERYVLEHSAVDDYLRVAAFFGALLFFAVVINLTDGRKYYV